MTPRSSRSGPVVGTTTYAHVDPTSTGGARVCGIVNVTPDSFSDGGRYLSADAAIEHGLALAAQGADMLDIGGESTRPGSVQPTVSEEIDRVIPVVEGLSRHTDLLLSIDTSRPEVMRAAADAGARFLNDVRAFREPGALDAAVELDLPMCLVHMRGTPKTMQDNTYHRGDIVAAVRRFLAEQIDRCRAAGVRPEHIVVDPGFGFGKSVEQNFALLSDLGRIASLGAPVLVGVSRKSMIGHVTGNDVDNRVVGSVVAAAIAVQNGASILRVHDVAETVDAMAVLSATRSAARPAAAQHTRAS